MIANAEQNNLHVMNFSEPKQSLVNFQELDSHLYSMLPILMLSLMSQAILRGAGGFVFPITLGPSLIKKNVTRSRLIQNCMMGFLRYGEHVLPGKSKETIIITSYLCHPSLANNELSGPISLVLLYNKLKSLKNRLYTYRFLLIPETIGSIASPAQLQKKFWVK